MPEPRPLPIRRRLQNVPTPERSNATDDELMTSLIAGDIVALEVLYDRYSTLVFSVSLRVLYDRQLAEDVTQEVFLVLMRELERYDPARGPLGTYLYAIARNVSRHRLRKERRFVGLEFPIAKEPRATDDPAHALMRSQTVARVRLFISGLSPRYREVLILCDLHGLSYEEASAVLNTRVGTVRSRLHRARKYLAERLVHADRRQAPITQGTRKCLI